MRGKLMVIKECPCCGQDWYAPVSRTAPKRCAYCRLHCVQGNGKHIHSPQEAPS